MNACHNCEIIFNSPDEKWQHDSVTHHNLFKFNRAFCYECMVWMNSRAEHEAENCKRSAGVIKVKFV